SAVPPHHGRTGPTRRGLPCEPREPPFARNKTPLQATGEALRARRGGARLGQKQGHGRSADLLHVADILAARPVDVNSTPAEHGGLSRPHRSTSSSPARARAGAVAIAECVPRPSPRAWRGNG